MRKKNRDQDQFSRHVEAIQARLVELFGQEKEPSQLVNRAFEELSVLHEELQIADQELRAQNEELAAARVRLEAERQRYRDLFEFAPDGYLVTNPSGVILEANQAVSLLLNVPAHYLTGKPLAIYIAKEHRKDFRWRLVELAETRSLIGQRVEDWEILLQPRDSNPFYAAITVEGDRPGNALLWLIRDIRQRKQAQAELEEVQRKLVESRDQERLEIAQELHDGPVQDLYGLAFQLRAMEGTLNGGEEAEKWEVAHRLLQHVINTLRSVSGELRPPTLTSFGLEKAIHSHVQTIKEAHPQLNIHLDLTPDRKTIPEATRLALFRIYQVAIANVIRHAQASQVWIRMELDGEGVRLDVQDDGVGFEVPKRWTRYVRQGHLGLVGAAERAELVGGQFQVISSPGKGTTVKVRVPIPNDVEVGNSED